MRGPVAHNVICFEWISDNTLQIND